jgi:hypothetical protein
MLLVVLIFLYISFAIHLYILMYMYIFMSRYIAKGMRLDKVKTTSNMRRRWEGVYGIDLNDRRENNSDGIFDHFVFVLIFTKMGKFRWKDPAIELHDAIIVW